MRRLVLLALSLTLVLAACASGFNPPSRAPDAVGTAAVVETSGDVTEVLFEHDVDYEYFDGTTFVLDDQVDIGGKVAHASGIEAGDRVVVWTGPCAESFPVQCQVEAIKVEE